MRQKRRIWMKLNALRVWMVHRRFGAGAINRISAIMGRIDRGKNDDM